MPLALRFAERTARRMGRSTPTLAESARSALLSHSWPGNIRELRNVIERAVVVSGARGEIDAADLAIATPWASAVPAGAPSESLREQLQREEKARVLDALVRARGNQTEAAKLLGVARRTLINKIEAFGIERPRKK